jgi:hypothetical protein
MTVELLSTTDAQKWAQEFVRMHGGDEGLMISWFANAIETGRTFAPVEPSQLAVYAENQVEVNKSRGEYASAVQWQNIAAAAHYLVQLGERIAKKEAAKS